MDDVEERLRRDAAQIQVQASPELQQRIDASLHAAREIRTVARERPTASNSLWWISSLTGLTAAAVVIFLINWNNAGDSGASSVEEERFVSTPRHKDGDLGRGLDMFRPTAKPADLTRPLEQELLDLQADLEKARENIERDITFEF